MAEERAKTKWWLGALLTPCVTTGLGVLIALLLPRHESDWLGMRVVAPIGLGLLVGCAIGFCLMLVSIVKKEEGAFYAVAAFTIAVLFTWATTCGSRR